MDVSSIAASADTASAEEDLGWAVGAYLNGPRPLYTRLPISYRVVPMRLRTTALRIISSLRRQSSSDFPAWPIERCIDTRLRERGTRITYAGKSAALIVTHDIDSHGELSDIAAIRTLESDLGVPSAFGFVPAVSWPGEDEARSLVNAGCEVYWHDIGHDGRLPYLPIGDIRAAFDRVVDRDPWAAELMKTFRAGQLLVSEDLMEVVAERFDIDMSIPDTERGGPFGGAAGCGTTIPFHLGPLLELPVTLPQEVYLLHVYGMTVNAALKTWLDKLAYVKSVGGVAVLNIHPIWMRQKRDGLSDAFTQFLEIAISDGDLFIGTPTSVVSAIANARDTADRS